MKKHLEHLTHKIKHHTKKTVHTVRAKPYAARMHIIRLCTLVGSLCVVVLWITFLKHQLKIDPIDQKREIEKREVISEGIWKVYDKAKDPNQAQ